MKYILSVEDSKFFSTVIKKALEKRLNLTVVSAYSKREAMALLESGAYEFFLALLDLTLPDALEGEIVDEVKKYDIPIVVFSAEFEENIREQVLSKNVIDYVVKDNKASLESLVRLIIRIYRNRNIKALSVDDSATARRYVSDLLEQYQFQVFSAASGNEALDCLKQHPDIKLIVTDYNMPGMDGIELTREVRQRYPKEKIVIIGLSTSGSGVMSARFVKGGGNDFLNKPFLREEFFCRISQNMDLIELISDLETAVSTDFLTGLLNRRAFFGLGQQLINNATRQHISLAVAMIDIDHFKRVNDVHGHELGDRVLAAVADAMAQRCRSADILARLGGEEFCLVSVNMDPAHVEKYFDALREAIENLTYSCEADDKPFEPFNVTVSIGLCTTLEKDLARMLKKADEALLEAKSTGRNRVRMWRTLPNIGPN